MRGVLGTAHRRRVVRATRRRRRGGRPGDGPGAPPPTPVPRSTGSVGRRARGAPGRLGPRRDLRRESATVTAVLTSRWVSTATAAATPRRSTPWSPPSRRRTGSTRTPSPRAATSTRSSTAAAPDHAGTCWSATATDLVGHALLDGENPDDPVAELAVHPAHRRRGVGAAAGRRRARGVRRRARFWAHGDHPGAAPPGRARRPPARPRAVADAPARARARGPAAARARRPRRRRDPPAARRAGRGRRGRREQPRVRLAPRAERLDDATTSPRSRRSPGSTPTGCCWRGTPRPSDLLGFHFTKVHAVSETVPEPLGEVYVVGVDPDGPGPRSGPGADPRGAAPPRRPRAAHDDPLRGGRQRRGDRHLPPARLRARRGGRLLPALIAESDRRRTRSPSRATSPGRVHPSFIPSRSERPPGLLSLRCAWRDPAPRRAHAAVGGRTRRNLL